MYNLTKFARVYGAQSGNMCKVDHQALSYSKVLSETHLLVYYEDMRVLRVFLNLIKN